MIFRILSDAMYVFGYTKPWSSKAFQISKMNLYLIEYSATFSSEFSRVPGQYGDKLSTSTYVGTCFFRTPLLNSTYSQELD